ncbi:MAG: carbonic anhydrase [Bryobacterales bacterium]|nr:carbonic anhydrase [Bryobacterales bacterium]
MASKNTGGVIKELSAGWQRYQAERHSQASKKYRELSEGQSPKVLFVTCADSRIEPSVIFQTDPGELFVARNPGNLVPPLGALLGGASASLEYALTALEVSDVIVCGHSNCGAMKGVLNPDAVKAMPGVAHWLQFALPALSIQLPFRRSTSPAQKIELLAKQNAVCQLQNLATYPVVAKRLAEGVLRLHAWYYDIPSGAITCFDNGTRQFEPLTQATAASRSDYERVHLKASR